MKTTPLFAAPGLKKTPSGIVGFDKLTGGGLPRGRSTPLAGGAGSGKTIFALQFLAHGARDAAARRREVARTTASHKGQITKGRRRLRQLRGGDLNTTEPR
jgi:KaiC/GvpD/RAD55 family RecA-like ATPase